jgi:hypothetical protein
MAHEPKLTSGKGDMNARIAARLRPSNEHSTAQHHAVQGSGPTRASHTVHVSGSQRSHGPLSPDGEGGGE